MGFWDSRKEKVAAAAINHQRIVIGFLVEMYSPAILEITLFELCTAMRI